MGADASLTPAVQPVTPGEEAAVEITVTNTGSVVDSFTLEVLGDPAAWALAEPSGLSLFPGQSETATLRFRPPVDPGLTPGPRPFAVRISSNEDPQHPRVEEGTIAIAGVAVLSADLSPRTGRARGKRAGRYQVALDNRGNAPVLVDLSGYDAQDLVDVTVQPPRIEVGPGAAAFVTARARARNRFWRGPGVLHRFTVAARPVQPSAMQLGAVHSQPTGAQPPSAQQSQQPGPAGPAANTPPPLDASLLQEAAIPAWVGKAAALLLLAAVALAALWFTVLKPVVRDTATGAANQALTAAGLVPGAGSLGGGAGGGAAGGGGASPSGSATGAGSGGGSSASSSPSATAPTTPAGPTLPVPVPFAVDLKSNGALTAGTHQVYTVTDLVLQNPNGDTGSLTITRGGNTLISTRMENFRDYDLHFVTAITVGSGQSLTISVTCDKPGQGQSACTPAVLVSGMSHTVA